MTTTRWATLSPPRRRLGGVPAWIHDDQGCELILREARRADSDDIRSLHERCSEVTVRWRYLTAAPQVEHVLTWAFDPQRGRTIVAVHQGRIVGMAHLVRTADPELAEVAFLIEDEWQDRGIGSTLVDLLTQLARDAGYLRLHADLALDNDRMRHILLARAWTLALGAGLHSLDLELD